MSNRNAKLVRSFKYLQPLLHHPANSRTSGHYVIHRFIVSRFGSNQVKCAWHVVGHYWCLLIFASISAWNLTNQTYNHTSDINSPLDSTGNAIGPGAGTTAGTIDASRGGAVGGAEPESMRAPLAVETADCGGASSIKGALGAGRRFG
jgi:hypothetical protein